MKKIAALLMAFVLTAAVLPVDAANTQTVYVLSKVNYSFTKGATTTFTYSKKGFIAKSVDKMDNYKSTDIYTCSAAGNVTAIKQTYSDSSTPSTAKLSYTKGKLTKTVVSSNGINDVHTYKWKKDKITSETEKYGSNAPTVYTYKYDSNGNTNVIKAKSGGSTSTNKVTWKYKNKRAVKKTIAGSSNTYTYKKIKVSKKDAAKIKKQQWYILNGFI